MLDNFIFSLSAAVPIFLVMCVGYLLRKKDFIDNSFIKAANRVVFYLALPIKLFNDVREIQIQKFFDLKFFLFIFIGTLIGTLISLIISKFAVNKESQRGAFIQGAFRGNFLYLGFSLMENIMGSIGDKAPIVVAVVVPLYNILAVIIFSLYQSDKRVKIHISEQILKILKNPMIISIFLGVLSSAINLNIPLVASRTMSYFQNLATPLALLTIGATFDFKKISDNIKPALIASGLKLIFIPLLAVISALTMGFDNYDVLLIYILFGVPTATVSFIMAAAMDGDKELASSIVMLTTLLSVITMTIFIFVFKTIGII